VEHDNWVHKNQLATADSNTKSILVNDVSQGLKTTNQLDVGVLPSVLLTLHANGYLKASSRHHTHSSGGLLPGFAPLPFPNDASNDLAVC
jgi:hypothetical protein